MQINNETNFYSHKVEMYIGDSEILCFRAYIELDKPESHIIKKVNGFGKDPLSIDLFEDIIYGRIKDTYFDQEMNEFIIEINEGNAEDNLNKYIELQDKYFATRIKLEVMSDINHVGLRFNGAPYNLRYSIPRKMENRFKQISDNTIKILEDETESDEFYYSEPFAASTMIRYSNEKLDPTIEIAIKKLSKDIANRNIDINYLKDDTNKEACIYRGLLKTFKNISTISELDTFEIHINDNPYPINNFDYLKEAEEKIYSEAVTGRGIKQGFEYIKDGHQGSLKIQTVGGHTVRLHIDKEQSTMLKDAEFTPCGSKFAYKGFQSTSETIDCTELWSTN